MLRYAKTTMASIRPILTVVAIVLGCSPTTAEESIDLDRNHLLQYRDASGKVQRVATPADWQACRAEILRGMQEVMGNLPGDDRRVPLEVEVEEEAEVGTYVRRLITYQSEPGSRTPAYLCIPKDVLAGQRKAPAVLCLHPTDNQVGHKVVVGLGGRPGRQYAAELAERGYVTLSPSYPHLADYWPNLGRLGYVSGTMKAIWDNSRGLDLLASLPYVDDSRGFGAIGHSLGGHNAIYTAVFDPRITVVASSCGFDSYLHYYDGAERNWYFGKGWCQIRYMPRLVELPRQAGRDPVRLPRAAGRSGSAAVVCQRAATRQQLPVAECRCVCRGGIPGLRAARRQRQSHHPAPRLRPRFPRGAAQGRTRSSIPCCVPKSK